MKQIRTKFEMEKLTEASKDDITRSVLKGADQENVNNVRNYYYGVSDNIFELVRQLSWLNHKTGEFKTDLTAVKSMLKSFQKLTLGKFI